MLKRKNIMIVFGKGSNINMISLVIPCYNEENNVEDFFRRCLEVFHQDIEYIFINDGSKDHTYDKIENLSHDYSHEKIIGINFSKNFGKEAAMLAGLKKASGDYISVIDADLQQDPMYVLKMVEFLQMNQDYDAVACYQDVRKESKLMVSCKSLFYSLVNKISDTHFERNASDFRTFRKYVVDSIIEMKEYYRFSKGIFSWAGFNTYYMPYTVQERHAGVTSWNFRKLTSYALDGFVSFSTAPLRLATYLGLIASLGSLIYMFIVIIQKLFIGNVISGYTTIVCLILLIGGILMILLGIIGEYLARTYIEVKQRPIYIIKDEIDYEKDK
ncbi:MAG: glycosyltransferase family 2 protein [Erysipelotrichaceae bacterium]|nr:glycosyltransferase family 2 protein [Erysipelotrichaceae bacterium]